jgi:hypothetical protein
MALLDSGPGIAPASPRLSPGGELSSVDAGQTVYAALGRSPGLAGVGG